MGLLGSIGRALGFESDEERRRRQYQATLGGTRTDKAAGGYQKTQAQALRNIGKAGNRSAQVERYLEDAPADFSQPAKTRIPIAQVTDTLSQGLNKTASQVGNALGTINRTYNQIPNPVNPASYVEVAKKLGLMNKDVTPQGIATGFAREATTRGAGRIINEAINRSPLKGRVNPVEPLSGNDLAAKVSQLILGKERLGTASEDVKNLPGGKYVPTPLAIPLGIALNVPGVGGASEGIEQVSKQGLKKLVKAEAPDLVEGILKKFKGYKNLDEGIKQGVRDGIAQTKNPEEIQAILKTAQDVDKQIKGVQAPVESKGVAKNVDKPIEKQFPAKQPNLVGKLSPRDAVVQAGLDKGYGGLLKNGDKPLVKLTTSEKDYIYKSASSYMSAGDQTVIARANQYVKKTGEISNPTVAPTLPKQLPQVPAPANVPDVAKVINDIPPATKAQLDQAVKPLGVENLDEALAKGQGKAVSDISESAPTKAPIQTSLESLVKAPAPADGLKTRGFPTNISKDNFGKGNATATEVVESIPGYRPITNKKTLTKAASDISKNPQAVFADIVTKPQLTSADDVAKGNLLLRDAIERGDAETAVQIGTKLGIDGTKLGQAVQAYSTFKRTTPEGIIQYGAKKALRAGKELAPAQAQELVNAAKKIADMPEGLEKAKATRELLQQANKVGRKYTDVVGEILSTPRAAMATADLSAPLRQGAVLGSRFPKEFAKNAKDSVKYFGSPKVYEKAMYEITQRPSYNLMKSHKLAVDGAEKLSGTEEQFLDNILEKIPGVGIPVRASDRGYTGFLTKFRADVFDKVVADSNASGVKLGKEELDSLAKFINSASGRGDGKVTQQLSKLQVLFSPRLWKSRLDTFNPVYIAKLKGPARKLALQSAASFAGIATTVIGMAAVAGADVETDPRSADFGKIKVGNTRYDILGGHQQNIRLAAQLISGQKINSETGEIQTLGPERGFGKPSRLDILYQFIENKENPVIGYASKLLRGTDAAGNKINKVTEAGKLLIPLNIQGAYETAKDQGSAVKGIAMNIPGTFGIGVQTYGKKPSSGKTTDTQKIKDIASNKNNDGRTLADYYGKGKPLFDERQGTIYKATKAEQQKMIKDGLTSQQEVDAIKKRGYAAKAILGQVTPEQFMKGAKKNAGQEDAKSKKVAKGRSSKRSGGGSGGGSRSGRGGSKSSGVDLPSITNFLGKGGDFVRPGKLQAPQVRVKIPSAGKTSKKIRIKT